MVVSWRLPSLVSTTYKTINKKGKRRFYTTYCHRMGYLIVFLLPCLFINCFLSSRDQRGNELVVSWRLPSLVLTIYKTINKKGKSRCLYYLLSQN